MSVLFVMKFKFGFIGEFRYTTNQNLKYKTKKNQQVYPADFSFLLYSKNSFYKYVNTNSNKYHTTEDSCLI